MDILLLCVALLLTVAGLVGSFLPVIPGPPLGWLGLLLLHLTDAVPMNFLFIGVTLVLVVVMIVLDYVIPAAGTKRFEGSKAGAIGTTVGLIVGLVAPIPFGILIGPFAGALIGELIFNNTTTNRAFKAALGSFLGFLASIFMKVIVSIVFTSLFISKVITHSEGLF